MAEWIIPALWVMMIVGIVVFFARRGTRRQIAATLARRANLTREEFLNLVGNDVSPEAGAFLWDTALVYLEPKLTPHPEDDLVRDLPILEEDWIIDWPRDFAEQIGFDDSKLPDWPEGWPITLRNYGRWLDMGAAE